MTKKAYISPATEVMKIESVHLMAGSQTMTVYSNDDEGVSSIGDLLSRDGNAWDDED